MAVISEAKNNKSSKLWLTLFTIAGLIYLIDFIFYGQALHDLAAASGFALIAVGAYKNNNLVGTAGAVLAFGGIIAKHFA